MINWLVNPDDEVFSSEDNAIEGAFDNLACIPAAVSQWLSEVCDVVETDRMVHNPYRLGHRAKHGDSGDQSLTPAQALAVLFGSHEGHAMAALLQLREHYRDAISDDAHAIGHEAWAKQCLEDQQIINMGREYE